MSFGELYPWKVKPLSNFHEMRLSYTRRPASKPPAVVNYAHQSLHILVHFTGTKPVLPTLYDNLLQLNEYLVNISELTA